MTNRQRLGGVIHTYQKYDPKSFPSPTQPPPDAVSPAFEHMLMFGSRRRLTEEELARAVRIDPSQIAGLGPSLDALMAMLLERKRKILAKYETDTVQQQAGRDYRQRASVSLLPSVIGRGTSWPIAKNKSTSLSGCGMRSATIARPSRGIWFSSSSRWVPSIRWTNWPPSMNSRAARR